MKPKTKQFADILLNDPKISATQAYMKVHKTTNSDTARANASKLLAKTSVQLYMDKHVDKAKNVMVKLMDSKSEQIQMASAKDILDRTHGKATQRTENINVNIETAISELFS